MAITCNRCGKNIIYATYKRNKGKCDDCDRGLPFVKHNKTLRRRK